MTQLLLIRHGINDMVGQKKLAGWLPGVHLSEEGRTQANELVDRLRNVPINAIYASPLDRTQETAEPLARARELPIMTRDGLAEVNYGDWTGKSIDELNKLDLWRVVQLYPSGMRFPGGDGMRAMQMRIVDELEAIAADHPREIVAVFSHADLIKAALAHYLGVHFDLFQRIVVNPVSINVVLLHHYGPRVLRINDDGPLKLELEKDEAAEAKDNQTTGSEPTESANSVTQSRPVE